MKTKFDLKKGIISLSSFRQASKDFIKKLQNSHQPIILTQNGTSAAILISPEDYQKLEYERELFRAIAQGQKDVSEDLTISHEKLFKELLS